MTENFASLEADRPANGKALQGQLWFKKTGVGSGDLYVRKSITGGAETWSKILTEDAGSVPIINPTGTPKVGDIKVDISIPLYPKIWVFTVISAAWPDGWSQVFPAVYS